MDVDEPSSPEKEVDMKDLIGMPILTGECLVKEGGQFIGGLGTYSRFGFLHSTLAGVVQITPCKTTGKSIVQIKSLNSITFPRVGDLVTCKVKSVDNASVIASIYCVGDHVLKYPLAACILKEDVRSIDKGLTDMGVSFRPEDIILAKVISVGENRTYMLSTADDNLGVCVAYCGKAGSSSQPMMPISWTEMQCPITFFKEKRKVAKVSFEK